MRSVTFETDNANTFTFLTVKGKEVVRWEGWYGFTCTLPLEEFLEILEHRKKGS